MVLQEGFSTNGICYPLARITEVTYKKRERMKNSVIVILFILVAVMVIPSIDVKASDGNLVVFESKWTLIQANQALGFNHNLGQLPTFIDGKVGQYLVDSRDFEVAVPIEFYGHGCVAITVVTKMQVGVQNNCDEALNVKVNAGLWMR
jgi:hypothetical protein